MTVHLSASMSYDVMILACMFLFTAVCLDLAYHKEKVQIRDIALLMALMAAAGPCKMVYGVMMGFCLLIPVKKFGGWGRWLLSPSASAESGLFCRNHIPDWISKKQGAEYGICPSTTSPCLCRDVC